MQYGRWIVPPLSDVERARIEAEIRERRRAALLEELRRLEAGERGAR